jgi:hypothetical protein
MNIKVNFSIVPTGFESLTYGYTDADIKANTISIKNNTSTQITVSLPTLESGGTNFTIVSAANAPTSDFSVTGNAENSDFSIKPNLGLAVGVYSAELKIQINGTDDYTTTITFEVTKATWDIDLFSAQTQDGSVSSSGFTVERTDNLTATAALEYSILATGFNTPETTLPSGDKGCVFSGLAAGKGYTVRYRVKGDANHNPSAEKSFDVYTAYAKPAVDDVVTVNYQTEALNFKAKSDNTAAKYEIRIDDSPVVLPFLLTTTIDAMTNPSFDITVVRRDDPASGVPSSEVSDPLTIAGRGAAPVVSSYANGVLTLTDLTKTFQYRPYSDGQSNTPGSWTSFGTVGVNGVANVGASYEAELRFPSAAAAFASKSVRATHSDFVIEASQTVSASTYATGNIVFKSDNDNTAQMTDADGLFVNGVVKFVKPLTSGKWYAIGFPFDIANVSCDRAIPDDDTYDKDNLLTFNPAGNATIGYGDYWLQTYKGDEDKFYNYTGGSATIAAGGYTLQIPESLSGATFTFTSVANPTLNSADAFTADDATYTLTNSPAVANTTVSATESDKYYLMNLFAADNFGLLNSSSNSTYAVKPFESVVIARGVSGTLRSVLGTGQKTDIPTLTDPIIKTEYYNLQGQRYSIPPSNGRSKGTPYIVREVRQSGKVSSKIVVSG